MTLSKLALGLALCGALSATLSAHAAQPLPGDDFYLFVNGEWLAKAEIPADRASWGAATELREATNQRIVQLIEGLTRDRASSGEARKIGDFYAAFMDEAAIEAQGTAPLLPLLQAIEAIPDRQALTRALGASLRADVDVLNATDLHTENLFGLWITQSLTEPARNRPYLLQGGLGLPDRAYYLDESPRMAGLRAQYQAHVATMFKLAGLNDSEARAARVMALETKIAQAHASREDSNDVLKGSNRWTLKDFAAKAPGLDWAAFFKSAGLSDQQQFIVWQPGAVTGAAALVASAELAAWKDHLAFHTINPLAAVLPKAFADAHFAFYGTAVAGTPQQPSRSKRALAATNGALGEAVGHLYVDKYFPAAHKAQIQQMVGRIVAAFDKRIDKLAWMAPSTRAEARAKLKTLYVGVAYPERWQSYEGLVISSSDALGNQLRSEQFRLAQQLARLHKPVDRREWAMSPHEVNALNLPMANAMNFPAAILQPPFYDPAASDAQNYGAIGAVIGHEISHSFDDAGAQFDAQGRLRDWWMPADGAHFKAAAAALAAQYSAYRPFPDLALNGQQTLSENLADLAGLAAAYDAFRASQAGKKANAAEADRQFFISYAAAWRGKMREGAERQQILTGGHAPGQYRAATVRNLDAWYPAFDVQPGQQLYLAPEARVRVW